MMMKFATLRFSVGAFALLGVLPYLPCRAAEDKKDSKDARPAEKKEPKKYPFTFTDPAEAGKDYQIQGEYEGTLAGKGKMGAQVVARGEGKFDVYILTGGLPGAGWDTKGRVKISGKIDKSDVVNFATSDKEWKGTIADGKLKLSGADGTLQHVERKSQTLGAKAPAGALILFDGTSADEWKNGRIVEKDLLFCGTDSVKKLAAGTLHIEFRTPLQPKAGGQGRGNSGVYVQGYEVQVLDSFGLTGDKNECGAIYDRAKPAVNMCFPPLSWQTYDIEIKADDKGNTVATVLHNGVKVHDNFVLRKGGPTPMSIHLQDHGNPVMYRNIWFVQSK